MNKIVKVLISGCIFFTFLCEITNAQEFTRADSLRGGITPMRSCYDVTFYDLEVKLSYEMRRLAGTNVIHFRAEQDFIVMQLDLFENLKIARILYHGKELRFTREFNAVFVTFPEIISKGSQDSVSVIYGGTPREAVNPPWDGGLIWGEDDNGKPWMTVACEGLGASSWWPLKDHLSDEPDSMHIALIVPEDLVAISNGNLRGRKKLAGNFIRWQWAVRYPINSYNVTFYIGDYVQFFQEYENEGEKYRLDYYVLSYNESKAKDHFNQVKGMLDCFEQYFGPYPFPEDGFALVEANYWGMEHQSAIAYGNEYKNNKWGFDFIIIHEAAHEWFGNSLSINDHAELWIHESFATYAEMIYMECRFGHEKALEYLQESKARIEAKNPMLGPLGVNYDFPDSDIYMKGSWMLHSLRNTVNDDQLWFQTLREFAMENRISHLTTEDVIQFFNRKLGKDYTAFFYQYLRHADLPQLSYRIKSKGKKKLSISYRWDTPEEGFNMPVQMTVKGKFQTLYPTDTWQSLADLKANASQIEFDSSNFLYKARKVEE